MPESKKPRLALVEGGVKSFEDYKRMITGMTQSLFGRPTALSDVELKKRYEEFVKKAAEGKNNQ